MRPWTRGNLETMIELIQIPYSPFCLVQHRILEYAGVRFRVRNIPNGDRSLVWKITRGRYYEVPVIRDRSTVVFETGPDSQVIAKYLDDKLGLGLFPWEWEGVQSILWRYIENEIESVAFKLNDVHYRENVGKAEWLPFLRHKERRFGRGCLERWAAQQDELMTELSHRLMPCEEMLFHHAYLLGSEPRFVDFDLFGMLANYLYSGHYVLPAAHTRLRDWHRRMSRLRRSNPVHTA